MEAVCLHKNIQHLQSIVKCIDCNCTGKRVIAGLCWKCGPEQILKNVECTKSCPPRYDYICSICGQIMVLYGSKTLTKKPNEPHTIIIWQKAADQIIPI